MQHLDEETLQAWLDGARSGLDPSRLRKVERHLAVCDACASRANALADSSFEAHALLALGRDAYAPRMSYEDVARSAQGAAAGDLVRLRKIPATWAASVAAALVVGWMSNDVLRGGSEPQGPMYVGPAGSLAASPAMGLTEAGAFARTMGLPTPDVVLDRGALSPEVAAALLSPSAAMGLYAGVVVRGLVADEGGRPVPAAEVYVAELDVSVLTQEDGTYDLTLPMEPDSFEITVQRIGYRQQVRAFSAQEGEGAVDADFRLREEALALDEIVVPGSPDDGAGGGSPVASSRARPFVWRPMSSIAAEGYVGSELWMLPGHDVVTIDVAYGENANETHVARVRQDLGGGATLTLVQGRTDGRRIGWPVRSEGAVLSTRRGEMLITATAPVSKDALGALLRQIR